MTTITLRLPPAFDDVMRDLATSEELKDEPILAVDRQQYIVGLLSAFLDRIGRPDVREQLIILNEVRK